LLNGIEKDLKKKNFIVENRFISLNYGKDAQNFFTKTENGEIIYWWEEKSLFHGFPKTLIENINKGIDVIITVNSSSIRKIQKKFEKETMVVVVEITCDESTLKMLLSNNAEDSELYLQTRMKQYMEYSRSIELTVPRLIRVYHNGSIEKGKKELREDILSTRQEMLLFNERIPFSKKSLLLQKKSTNHKNYCFMDYSTCCHYNENEVCKTCHLSFEEKQKVKLSTNVSMDPKECNCSEKKPSTHLMEWKDFIKCDDEIVFQ
jgi:ribose 1,5-bisphosphokinase PhnN